MASRRLRCWGMAAAFAFFALAGMPCRACAGPLSSVATKQIDAIVREAMAKEHLIGVEVGIGRRGTLLFSRGYGLRDRAGRKPVTAGTVFPIGSITKQFTAAAVMQLEQSGSLSLDARIARYLPTAPHASSVSVRELLDQTSGLPDYLDNKPLLTTILNGTVTPQSVARYVALVDAEPLAFAPGTKWAYSNTNYALLGMLVASVSGTSYETYLTQHILEPQGLDRSQILHYSVPRGANVTRGYTYSNGVNALVPDYSMAWANAAGYLASTAGDLVRWDGAFFGGSVISRASLRIATTPPAGIPVRVDKDKANNIAIGYAFGWMLGSDEGRELIWHNGGLIGARAMNLVFPDDGLEIVVLTNATTADPEGIALRISRLLYDASP
jgi:D-alanyl-D-alanine carboxypeptidase